MGWNRRKAHRKGYCRKKRGDLQVRHCLTFAKGREKGTGKKNNKKAPGKTAGKAERSRVTGEALVNATCRYKKKKREGHQSIETARESMESMERGEGKNGGSKDNGKVKQLHKAEAWGRIQQVCNRDWREVGRGQRGGRGKNQTSANVNHTSEAGHAREVED